MEGLKSMAKELDFHVWRLVKIFEHGSSIIINSYLRLRRNTGGSV